MLVLSLLISGQVAHATDDRPAATGQVVLLHGLGRTSSSMSRIEHALERAGYEVCNVSYPSREHGIEELARDYVAPAIRTCFPGDDAPVHFVTHSLGGVIVRQLSASQAVVKFGRVVMLSPPNQGSEVVDKLGDWKLFRWLNGPAGTELGTHDDSAPVRLGSTALEVGVITGNRSINWILSMIIPGRDDGKVSVDRAKLAGMRDFLIVPSSHPFIMRNRTAIEQTIRFLAAGSFARETR